jgi:hypothetical protein
MPKAVFVKLETLKLDVMDAVITISDSSISRTKVLQNMELRQVKT